MPEIALLLGFGILKSKLLIIQLIVGLALMLGFIFFYYKYHSELSSIVPLKFKFAIQLIYKGSYKLHTKTIKVLNIKFRNAHTAIKDHQNEKLSNSSHSNSRYSSLQSLIKITPSFLPINACLRELETSSLTIITTPLKRD
jgi:hypothetical protein